MSVERNFYLMLRNHAVTFTRLPDAYIAVLSDTENCYMFALRFSRHKLTLECYAFRRTNLYDLLAEVTILGLGAFEPARRHSFINPSKMFRKLKSYVARPYLLFQKQKGDDDNDGQSDAAA